MEHYAKSTPQNSKTTCPHQEYTSQFMNLGGEFSCSSQHVSPSSGKPLKNLRSLINNPPQQIMR
ncbi:MAG: hypothetical protein K1566_19475, partial [Candidatus Thiodiazotropha sp. (ex. Lucinisca nassula)]|nr:hypothetical protein [Candidatus Thiodiazotropha sp. (ex. Lucinisca nassula)]